MVKIQFYALDIESNNELRIYGKTPDGKKLCAVDSSYKPYFWVLAENPEKLKKKISVIEEDEFRVEKVEVKEMSYYDQPVKTLKITVNNLRAINPIAQRIKENDSSISCREIDLPLYKKYLIDKKLTPLTLWEADGNLIESHELNVDYFISGDIRQVSDDMLPSPRILALDIEVYGFDFGEEKGTNEPILMVSLVGSHNYKKVITWKRFKEPQDYVEFTDSEMSLIERMNQEIIKYSPDYIIGYFSDGFDFPYIHSRMKKYKLKSRIGLDGQGMKIRTVAGESTAKLRGIAHIDIFKFIKRIMSGSLELDSYSLDSVAKEILGKGKTEGIEVCKLSEAWDKGDIKKYCEYNLNDSVITLEIFNEILPSINELVKLIGSPIQEVSRMSYGQLVEHYLMRRSKDFDEIIPKRPLRGVIAERRAHTYQGAFVMEPVPGLYSNLVFLDFRNLYPTIIITKNICPSTFNLEKKGYESPEILSESGDKIRYYFDTKKEGFIPKVLKDIIERRNRVKEILKKETSPVLKARSYALKTVAAAASGYLGFSGGRWYCMECASSITAWAREYIQMVIGRAKEKKFRVIYSDTDSIAIVLEKKTKQDALNFLEEINKELPSLMELELEDFYKRGIFVYKKGETKGAKKKYALINEKNQIKIKGFETVRRDWSALARNAQYDILKIILEKNDPKKAMDYFHAIIKKIRSGKIEKNDLIIQTQLKMGLNEYEAIGPHVAIARKMHEKGLKVGPGSPIWYIVGEGTGRIRDRAVLPEEAKNYDRNYYINNQVLPAVEKIFEVLGYTKEDLLRDKTQSQLGEF